MKEAIKTLVERIDTMKENIATEEATKNAFIMPMLQMLGYDVFNPVEVVPELDCDITKKKGEKIDYAIMQNGEPIILMECKHWKQNLALHDTQLQKYFVASKAKFGVLTNGIVYKFYTDLVKPNIMDSTPFLEIDMLNIKSNQVEELKKFHKENFDIKNILSSAESLKYMNELGNIVRKEFSEPSVELVKLFAKQVYEGQLNSKVTELFTELTKRTLKNFIYDSVSERLNKAIDNTNSASEEDNQPIEEESKIVTTEEEIEGYHIIKSILRPTIPGSRITYRDAQSYFSVLIDDNNRRPVCRLYLNSPSNKMLAFLDDDKKEVRHKISSLDDLYNFSTEIIEAASKYI